MFDRRLRRWSAPGLELGARYLHRRSIGPTAVTLTGLTLGLGAATAAGFGSWWLALGLWLGSRVADGLDGALARLDATGPLGGFLDIIADFTVYGAFVVGVAASRPEARLAAVVLLCTYYISGAAFLAWSSLVATDATSATRSPGGLELDDERSLRFVGGLAEGFETVVAYTVICIFPEQAEPVVWAFAALVGVTAVQRVWFASSHLSARPPSS